MATQKENKTQQEEVLSLLVELRKDGDQLRITMRGVNCGTEVSSSLPIRELDILSIPKWIGHTAIAWWITNSDLARKTWEEVMK